MRLLTLVLLAALLAGISAQASPGLLLTPQRLRRLKKDRERQTQRWVNFETRVEGTPDSPERGFELALYYAVTGDRERGQEALQWAEKHPCEERQNALIQSWVNDLDHTHSSTLLGGQSCSPKARAGQQMGQLRDRSFATGTFSEADQQAVVQALEGGAYHDGEQLYSAMEFLAAAQANGESPRERAPKFFLNFPMLLLLSIPPDQMDHPDWRVHLGALALVSLEPNATGSQFLQGWAIENRQMLHDGPGVGYELLWADPYLPGVGYQNMDPWLLDEESGTLGARSDWTPNACWIFFANGKKETKNCPPNWDSKPVSFGHLRLLPMNEKCVEVPAKSNDAVVLWKLAPKQSLRFRDGSGKQQTVEAPPSGFWRLPLDVTGKVCSAR